MKKIRSAFIKKQSISHFAVPELNIYGMQTFDAKGKPAFKLVPNPKFVVLLPQERNPHLSKQRRRNGLTGKQVREDRKELRRLNKRVSLITEVKAK